MATIAEQMAGLALVDNLNRNSPEAPIAAPWEKPSFPTEIGYLESGWGYYPHLGATVAAALYGGRTLPTGGTKGWAATTEIRQNTTSVTGSPYWEIWLYLAKGAKTGLRAAAYQEGTGEAAQKYKIVLEKWTAGTKEALGEVTGVTIKGTSSLVGGCLGIAYLNGNAYVFTREESAAPFVQRIKVATAVPSGEYAGIGAQSATGVQYYPAVMNFRMGEIVSSIPEQIAEAAVLDTLKNSSTPASLTKLPWALNTGTWSLTTGWNPESYLLTTNPSSRSGLYYNIEKFKGGNNVVGWTKTTGSLANEDRRGGLWLYYQGGEKPSGYQLQWVTISKTGIVKMQLRKWVEGVETPLGEAAEVALGEGDSMYLVAYQGKVSMWRRTGAGEAELIGSEVSDSTFTEGYAGFDGNGSNPKMVNFIAGTLAVANVEFTFLVSGTSVSSGSQSEAITRSEVVSGSSISTSEAIDIFTMIESAEGTSESSGTDLIEYGELTSITVNGSSTSSASMLDVGEVAESPGGSSASLGSVSEEIERSYSMSGSSESSGSQLQDLIFDESVAGASVSSATEVDENIIESILSGISASSGSPSDFMEAVEERAGISSSTGKEKQEFQFEQPPQPVPSPVRPRRRLLAVRWKFFLCDSTTMELLGEIKQARGKNLQLALDKPGGCGFNIPIDYDLFKDVEEVNHGIIAYRGDTPRYSGMIWNIDENTDGNSIAVQSVGWFETLNHRVLRENVGYPPFSTGVVNAGQILFLPASGSVGTTSYHPGGLLTIANAQRDTWLVEGANKDIMQRIVSYQRGQSIGQAISQLTEVEAGFDFTVDPLTRVMDLYNWNEVPDKTEDVVFGYNWGNKNIERLGRQFDPSVMANRVTALGKYGGGFAEDIESQQKYQLFEEMPQLNDVVDPNVLLGYAGGEVLLRNRPRVMYSFQPFPYSGNKKVPQPFDDYDIGDMISFTAVKPPRIDIRGQAVRVYGMNIDVTDEGNEKVSALQISP